MAHASPCLHVLHRGLVARGRRVFQALCVDARGWNRARERTTRVVAVRAPRPRAARVRARGRPACGACAPCDFERGTRAARARRPCSIVVASWCSLSW
ncbi:hypothetical protein DB32_002816 [Sandaracinus amylolyticus]|uniref:Uncharacterized protein n=1 Tax=Sandaracinus amylolyticus TaxID=927083 RepID=A0A0F6W2D0_9BACT|nr:hypothetical protein DB32_002816 [Sandaracinus amylolyticus]